MNGSILLKQLCTVGAILLCLGVSGCRDDVKNIYKGDEGKEEPEKVPNDFDFSTSKSVNVSFKYNTPKGFRAYFEMFTACPVSLDEDLSYVKNPTLLPVAGGYTDENGKFSLTLDIASFVDDIYVYSTQARVPTLLHSKIVGNTASAFEEYKPEKIDAKSVKVVARDQNGDKLTAGSGFASWPAWKYGTSIQPIEGKMIPLDNIDVTEKIQNEIVKSIETTVANTTSSEPGRFRNNIVLKEDAEVKLYYFSHGVSDRENSLTYFTYPENQSVSGDPLTYLKGKIVMAFDQLSDSKINEGVQLQYNNNGEWSTTFPKGTALSFALITGASTEYRNVAFSEMKYNHYEIKLKDGSSQVRHTKPHMGVFKFSNSTEDKAYIVLCFEDYPWSESPEIKVKERTQTFDDDVFIMEVNPKSALPDDIPDPTPGDTDKNPWTHFQKSSGVWAFEDNWPKNGDYDMNDIVVSYIRTLYINDVFNVVSLTDEIQFLNNGANYSNAFGYVLGGGVTKDNVTVTLTSTPETSYSQKPGLDNDLDKATIMLFDNGKSLNKEVRFEMHAEFKYPYPDYSSFSSPPFGEPVNPFIVVNGTTEYSRTEVHLPKYPPTEKNNNALFGTENDCSDPSSKSYYLSDKESSYPFAIDLRGVPLKIDEENAIVPAFTPSPEGKAIDESYPEFIDWVKSGGTSHTNWYSK